MQRPTGITVLAVLAAIGGVFGILGGLALIGVGTFVASSTGLGGLAAILGLIALAYGVLSLVLAYGFWTLQPWAWTLGVGLEVAGVVISSCSTSTTRRHSAAPSSRSRSMPSSSGICTSRT